MYPGSKKYGPVVTYQEKPSAHMKVEYGFDVDQVAEGNYAPKAYHDFIGFEVSTGLERHLQELIRSICQMSSSAWIYHRYIATLFQRYSVTKVAWHLKRTEIQNSHPSETKKEFIYNISNSGYRKE
jgi:hypothetical protein